MKIDPTITSFVTLYGIIFGLVIGLGTYMLYPTTEPYEQLPPPTTIEIDIVKELEEMVLVPEEREEVDPIDKLHQEVEEEVREWEAKIK